MTAPSDGGQDSIRSTRLGRTAALAGAGARVGMNYLRHYARRAVGGAKDEDRLHAENAAEVYETFSKLKGGPLKLAQMLSIDQNVLPPAYVREFAQAQYSAPPLSYPLVVRTFRREFGKEPREMFDAFEPKAAAGASIGQVHRATKDGHAYAVKVQYPGVRESLRNDLRVVKPIALAVLGLREADVAEFFAEVEARLLEETDYTLEQRRSIRLAEACANLTGVRFPAQHPKMSSPRIITMDWVDGEPLDRWADGPASQAERDQIGQALWDFYAFQVHELRVFHADPHPGNFLVRDGILWVLDFGCVKELDEDAHRRQFRMLEPTLLADDAALEAAMEDLRVLRPDDPPADRAEAKAVMRRSLELLGRPFREAAHDFGDPEFMRAIFALGEENRRNPTLRRMRGPRGSAEGLYVSRVYFGLYSLLSRLRARVRTGGQRT